MSWEANERLTQVFNELRLSIDHARFGEMVPYGGTHTLPTNRLYFNLDDTGEIFWAKEKSILKSGTIAFVPCNLPLRCLFSGGRLVAFHYNLEIFPEVDLFSDAKECIFLTAPDICQRVYESMLNFESLKDGLAIQVEIISLSRTFLNKDFSYFDKQLRLRKKHEKLLSLIANNLDATLNVEGLASMMKINRHTLSKSFSRDLGISLKAYLDKQLIRKASVLLRKTDTIKEVAQALRFNDEFYFSKFFKRHTQMSPSSFRELPKEKNYGS